MFFKRGNFTTQDVENTAKFLAMFIMAVPFIGFNNNVSNVFSALRIIKEITPRYLILGLICTAAFILGVKYYGAYAYPVIFLAMYAVMTFMNIITVRTFAPFIPYGKNMLWVLKTILISFICAAIVKYAFAFYQGNVFMEILIKGSAFVFLNGLALLFSGDLAYLTKTAGIKWKLR